MRITAFLFLYNSFVCKSCQFTKADSLINFLSVEEWGWIGSSAGFTGNSSTTPQSTKLFKKMRNYSGLKGILFVDFF